jgi:hypothetical protein
LRVTWKQGEAPPSSGICFGLLRFLRPETCQNRVGYRYSWPCRPTASTFPCLLSVGWHKQAGQLRSPSGLGPYRLRRAISGGASGISGLRCQSVRVELGPDRRPRLPKGGGWVRRTRHQEAFPLAVNAKGRKDDCDPSEDWVVDPCMREGGLSPERKPGKGVDELFIDPLERIPLASLG